MSGLAPAVSRSGCGTAASMTAREGACGIAQIAGTIVPFFAEISGNILDLSYSSMQGEM